MKRDGWTDKAHGKRQKLSACKSFHCNMATKAAGSVLPSQACPLPLTLLRQRDVLFPSDDIVPETQKFFLQAQTKCADVHKSTSLFFRGKNLCFYIVRNLLPIFSKHKK